MDTRYNIDLVLEVEPVWHQDLPYISVNLDNHTLFKDYVSDRHSIVFSGNISPGLHTLTVEFTNKTDQDTDTEKNLDKAIILKSLSLNGIADLKFIWAGIYRPTYPENWYNQQPPGSLPSALSNQTYLGWNGVWTLEFDIPIFTWIHKTQDLGWIYD